MSKGSNRRPKNITEKQFEENWEKVFARKKTPKHGRTKVHRDKTKYRRNIKHDAELFVLVSIFCISLIGVSPNIQAGPTDDNHVHIEQVNSGDGTDIMINQVGFGNTIEFSFDHANNIFNLNQYGNGNSISWVPYWGSGKSWGGDVDGTGNNEAVIQYDGATYGRHIWGNNNDVDIYQSGAHTHWLDIHADDVEHDMWQEGAGSHYSHVYYYGNTDGSISNIEQKGDANHNIQLTIQGSEATTLNLSQLGNTAQAYSITHSCFTVGGCTVNVSQGN